MRQRRWLELIKDYDMGIHYHPGKANVVADALSRKSHCNCLLSAPLAKSLCADFQHLSLEMVEEGFLATLEVKSTLEDQILEAQKTDTEVAEIKENMKAGKAEEFSEDARGIIRYRNRFVVPSDPQLRELILKEAHNSKFSIHPGSTKMYQDLKKTFWWSQMKRQIAQFVAECDICQRVKAEHLKPAGTLQPLPIPEWKWDSIGMDFITGLPRSQKGNDAIWVIVDCLTKVAHFIPVSTTYNGVKLAELYMNNIIRLHGVLKIITSDRGPHFTSRF